MQLTEKREVKRLRHGLLWGAWAVSFGLALLCSLIFVQGLLRDTRAGEPVIPLDLSKQSDWQSMPFRVWRDGTYMLFVSSVNHDPRFIGAPFAGDLEVAILDPDGRTFFARRFAGSEMNHTVPSNYGDSRLAMLELSDWPIHRWTLKARVLSADPRFETTRSQLKFWRQRYDPGMGGLINYAMIFPAGIFLLIAFFSALSLASSGRRWPLFVTLALALPYLALLIG